MTILSDLIRSAAKSFDDKTYPADVYFHLLSAIRSADTPIALGESLAQALAWKDGKVRRDNNGPLLAQPFATKYRIEQTKPNTLDAKHRQVLESPDFFEWANSVRQTEAFDISLIREMERKFGLWSSVVIPVFVLHSLNPRVFPIVDRWVIATHSFFDSNIEFSSPKANKITLDTYSRYQAWWLRVLGEAGLGAFSSQLSQLKEIDAGIWVLGKRLSAASSTLDSQSDQDAQPLLEITASALGTDSKEFKLRAISIRKSGASQRDAIAQAAREMGIELKPSYLTYPGSHFDRWKKQGLS